MKFRRVGACPGFVALVLLACRPCAVIADEVPPSSGALVSEFFRNDPTAIAIAAGETTRDINDFGDVLGYVEGDTRTFAYRVLSGYRQLGFSFPMLAGAGERPQETVQNRFQVREGLPVTTTIDSQLLLRLDRLLAEREAADALLGSRFPLFPHMLDEPLNEPSKTHLSAIHTLVFEKLPAPLVPWTPDNFKYAGIQEDFAFFNLYTPDFTLCVPFYYQTLDFNCAVMQPFTFVWTDDLGMASTALHEYAHFLDVQLWIGNIPGTASGIIEPLPFYDISFDTSQKIKHVWNHYRPRTLSDADFVSGYAKGWAYNNYYTPYEDFAESFAAYVLHGYEFRDLARSNAALAGKYIWLRRNVFGGREYDTGNRNYRAIFGPTTRPFNVADYGRQDPSFVWDYEVTLLGEQKDRCMVLSREGTGLTIAPEPCGSTFAVPVSKDSPVVEFARGNSWKEIGTWTATPGAGFQPEITGLRTWIGLKNSDDTGARFDLRADVYRKGELLASGVTRCIQNVQRNPDMAKEVTIPLGPFTETAFDGTDALSITVLTRMGTNPNGSQCPGRGSALGLRLYFDSLGRLSALENGSHD